MPDETPAPPASKRGPRPRRLPDAVLTAIGDPPENPEALAVWLRRTATVLLMCEARGELTREQSDRLRAWLKAAAAMVPSEVRALVRRAVERDRRRAARLEP